MIPRAFLYLFLSTLLSCLSPVEHATNNLQDIIAQYPSFSIVFDHTDKQTGSVEGILLANPTTGVMIAVLNIANITNDSLKLVPEDFMLSTEDGSRVHPVNMKSKLTISPGDIATVECMFHIINNRLFYSLTGRAGDINEKYQLDISFPFETEILTWQMTNEIHDSYLTDFGTERTTVIYEPKIDTDKQKTHQQSIGMADFVFSDGKEIVMAGINTQFQAYHVGDTLYIQVRITNHSIWEVKIHPEKFISQKGKLVPLQADIKHPVLLKKSERYSNLIRCYLEEPPGHFSASKEFLKVIIEDREETIFIDELHFTATSLNSHIAL